MLQSFSYSVTTCLPRESVWRVLTKIEEWPSPELGFANERTIRLEEVSCGTLIRVDAYTVGEPVREIPGGSLGFLKMLTEKWFVDFAHFCDNDCLQSPNCRRLDSTAAAEQDSGKV